MLLGLLGLLFILGSFTPSVLRHKGYIICRDEVILDNGLYCVGCLMIIIGNWFDPFLTTMFGLYILLMVRRFRKYWRLHKDHEEDCVYGPRKPKSGAKSKIARPKTKILYAPA